MGYKHKKIPCDTVIGSTPGVEREWFQSYISLFNNGETTGWIALTLSGLAS
jgi:hypothetical protein